MYFIRIDDTGRDYKESFERDGITLTITIEQDECPENPRKDFDNSCNMTMWHRKYTLGDDPGRYFDTMDLVVSESGFDVGDDEFGTALEFGLKWMGLEHFIKPIIMYEHSGIGLSTSKASYPFNCEFDAGQVGWIWISHVDAKKEWDTDDMVMLERKVSDAMDGEVAVYAQYLNGDVYSYSIRNEHGDMLDSLCGLYGFEYALELAREITRELAGKLADTPVKTHFTLDDM